MALSIAVLVDLVQVLPHLRRWVVGPRAAAPLSAI